MDEGGRQGNLAGCVTRRLGNCSRSCLGGNTGSLSGSVIEYHWEPWWVCNEEF